MRDQLAVGCAGRHPGTRPGARERGPDGLGAPDAHASARARPSRGRRGGGAGSAPLEACHAGQPFWMADAGHSLDLPERQ
eukprot:15316425-Alexandrium_andersonii.AAC.1